MQREVAKEHRISNKTVSCLVRKAQKNEKFFQELIQVEKKKADKIEVIKSVVKELNDNEEIIDSVDYVCKAITNKHNCSFKPWEVKKVMK